MADEHAFDEVLGDRVKSISEGIFKVLGLSEAQVGGERVKR